MILDGLTFEDFESLPRDLAMHAEIEGGRLIRRSANTLAQNRIRCALAFLLMPLARSANAGAIITTQAFAFAGEMYAPQISLIGADDFNKQQPDKRIQRFVPKLAIEIASESESVNRLLRKAVRYRTCGTQEVWLFLPETRQALHMTPARQVLLNAGDRFEPESVPGVSLTIGEVLDLD